MATYIKVKDDSEDPTYEVGYGYLQHKTGNGWLDQDGRKIGFGGSEVTDFYIGDRTADPASAPSGLTGTLQQWVNWITNRIKAITGLPNWYDTPSENLSDLPTKINGIATGLTLLTDTVQVVAPGGATGSVTVVHGMTDSPSVWAIVETSADNTSGIVLRVFDNIGGEAQIRWRDTDGLTPAAFAIKWFALGVIP